MNRDQINELNMIEATDQVLTTYNGVWGGNLAVSNIISTLRTHLTALNTNDALQKTKSQGATQSKDEARAAMIGLALQAANAGKAYATDTDNMPLFEAMSHGRWEMTKVADTDADDICQNIHDDLAPYITNTAAYGADAALLSNLQNAIAAFSALIGKPREQITIVANATITIAQHFKAVSALLKNQLDPIMMQYQNGHEDFFNEYRSARVIVDIGHRHTVILKGFIYDDNNHALADVLVALSGKAKYKKFTNATGKYKFTRLHTGSYVLTVSKSGFVTQTKTIEAVTNGAIETDFVLIATDTDSVSSS